ncbi:zinc-dependent alcohol dehydrogenase family protein [Enterococcus saccharolyticus]|uniref:Theronine dehydrogenase n=1 Tax=Candidatus Enterococcus willemsii TaxID=1857215 RepID=A0ABQ6YXV2_9ENTE|nr:MULTISPECIES: zinc-dependent alcohol dehydrogenase family protein [Enterococcus]KAF1302730.1 theronine dehydrogenase [Enterococcus sp. CU12B]MCD5002404.1 zinc-dependent alcohol dehydrogenase family protein [Enterococcus saccharolyticus]
MKALVLTEKQTMTIQDLAIPEITADEVLVKVKYCGICGTDVHIFNGEPGSAEVTPPVVLGHEFAGEIVKIGENVTQLAVGDHIAVDPNMYCGHCQYCRQGRIQLCENLSALGVTRNGGMAEYCAAPANACLKLAVDLPFEYGAMVEPLSCVLHGFDQIDPITPETTVLIIGGGFIGSLFLQTVQLYSPAKVNVCELNKEKHAQLLALGADEVYSSTDELTESFDLVIECVGRKETSEAAIATASKGANILLFGVPSPNTKLTIPAFDIFSKELKITSSFINPFTLSKAVHLLNQGKIQLAPLLSHKIQLESVPEILANYPAFGITKAIIEL